MDFPELKRDGIYVLRIKKSIIVLERWRMKRLERTRANSLLERRRANSVVNLFRILGAGAIGHSA